MAIVIHNDGDVVVNNVLERNLLTKRFDGMQVTVKDATGDEKLGGGSAKYEWDANGVRWALVWSDIVNIEDLNPTPVDWLAEVNTKGYIANKPILATVANSGSYIDLVDTPSEMGYQGEWDASTNTPTIVSGVGKKNDYYRVIKAGSTKIDTVGYWATNEYIVFDGLVWGRMTGNTSSIREESLIEKHVYGSVIDSKAQELITFMHLSKNSVSSVPISEVPISVNTSGLEWKSGYFRSIAVDIMHGDNLRRPPKSLLQFLKNTGVDHIRLPLAWEALQPVLVDSPITNAFVEPFYTEPGMFHTKYLGILKEVVQDCMDLGIQVVIDNHSFGKYYDNYYDPETFRLTIPRLSARGNYRFCTTNNRETLVSVTEFINNKVIYPTNNYTVGDKVRFTLGNVPPELTKGIFYHIVDILGSEVGISDSFGGTPLTFTNTLTTITVSKADLTGSYILTHIKADGELTTVASNLAIGTPLVFTTPDLPAPYQMGVEYYVVSSKKISATLGGPVLVPTGGEWKKTVSGRAVVGTVSSNNEGYYVERSIANGKLTSLHFVDFWVRFHQEFQNYDNIVGYGLANEVGLSQSGDLLNSIFNDTILALRNIGCNKLIYVDGPYTDSAKVPYTVSDFRKIKDPTNNFANEIHWYFDSSRSGGKYDFTAENYGVNSSVEGNPLLRSGSYLSDGYSGVDLATGARMGQSLALANKYSLKPVFVGETAFPTSSDNWVDLAKVFTYIARSSKTIVSLWGAASFSSFVYYMSIFPRLHGSKIIPDRQTSVLAYDAQEHICELCVFVGEHEFIVEMVGSATRITKVTITSTIPTGLPSEIYMPPGLNSLTKLKIPVLTENNVYTFTSSDNTVVTKEIPGVDFLKDGSAEHGKNLLLKTKSSLWQASSGVGDFSGSVVIDKVAVVQDSLNSDLRFFNKNLRSFFDGNVAVTTSALGKKAWRYSEPGVGHSKSDLLHVSFGGTEYKLIKVTARDNGAEAFASAGFIYNNGPENDGVYGYLSNEADPTKWRTLTFDGITLNKYDLVAVGNNYTAAGIYVVTEPGSLTEPTILTRQIGYEKPTDYDGVAVKIVSGINTKGVIGYFSNGASATGTWGSTGLTLSTATPSLGLNTETKTKYRNYKSYYSFGFSITRSGNWTAGRVGGISSATGSTNSSGFAVHTNTSNQLEFWGFGGDSTTVYGGYRRFGVSTTIPLDTETTVVVVIEDRKFYFYVNGILVKLQEELYYRRYNHYTYNIFCVMGIKNNYNYVLISDNCLVHNAFLTTADTTIDSTDALALHNYLLTV